MTILFLLSLSRVLHTDYYIDEYMELFWNLEGLNILYLLRIDVLIERDNVHLYEQMKVVFQ